ncbi:MAG: hypothetical protein H8E10_11605 [Desulfobacterales bacterium]|jgi:hypothetical protein|nr:hypothetical protein [Desulfobacterales bacterium]MBL7172724.1 hypothetical protein [Desulfobacteraceae bacterium]
MVSKHDEWLKQADYDMGTADVMCTTIQHPASSKEMCCETTICHICSALLRAGP